jgi:hypothetical protein
LAETISAFVILGAEPEGFLIGVRCSDVGVRCSDALGQANPLSPIATRIYGIYVVESKGSLRGSSGRRSTARLPVLRGDL